jgi:hypothetical protein
MPAHDSLIERIIAAGFRDLARNGHPDAGGSEQLDMDLLVKARDTLRRRTPHNGSNARGYTIQDLQRARDAAYTIGYEAGRKESAPTNQARPEITHRWVACGACSLANEYGDSEPCLLYGPTGVIATTPQAVLVWAEYEVTEVHERCGTSVLVKKKLWFPRSQMAMCCTLREAGDVGMLIVSEWIGREKGVVQPPRRRRR